MSLKKATAAAEAGDYRAAYELLLEHYTAPQNMEWVRDFSLMFPTEGEVYNECGAKIGYSPRQSLSQVLSRMKTFIKQMMPKDFPTIRPADRPEIILQATKMYIEEKSRADWAFVKKSTKFIYDQHGSVLAEYIRKIQDEGVEEDAPVQKISWDR